MCLRRSWRKGQVNLWVGVLSIYSKIHLLCQPLKKCTRSLRPDPWCRPSCSSTWMPSHTKTFSVFADPPWANRSTTLASSGFAHRHEKHHSEPRTKAIDIIQLFLGCPRVGDGSAADVDDADGVTEAKLTAWMSEHRKSSLQDAGTKQYDSAIESAKQFGCSELPEVFTAEEKKRCRLDGGEDEGGTLRLPNVDVVPTPEAAHVLRERMQAANEGRAMRHPYRGMPLTGAPAARFPKYLWAKRFNDTRT